LCSIEGKREKEEGEEREKEGREKEGGRM